MRLPAELCKMQRKKRETDEFSKNTLCTVREEKSTHIRLYEIFC